MIWITDLVSCFSNFHSSVNCSRFILHINLHAFPYFILLSCLCPGLKTGPNFILLRTLKTGLDHLKFMFSGSDLWLLTQDKHILIISMDVWSINLFISFYLIEENEEVDFLQTSTNDINFFFTYCQFKRVADFFSQKVVKSTTYLSWAALPTAWFGVKFNKNFPRSWNLQWRIKIACNDRSVPYVHFHWNNSQRTLDQWTIAVNKIIFPPLTVFFDKKTFLLLHTLDQDLSPVDCVII